MISLPLDESYCFDFLSILEIKFKYAPSDKCSDLQKKCSFYANSIAEQVSDDMFWEIKNSALYKELYSINKSIYQMVDNSKDYPVSPQTLDKANYQRWVLKDKIQKKFFGQSSSEIKLGYDKK